MLLERRASMCQGARRHHPFPPYSRMPAAPSGLALPPLDVPAWQYGGSWASSSSFVFVDLMKVGARDDRSPGVWVDVQRGTHRQNTWPAGRAAKPFPFLPNNPGKLSQAQPSGHSWSRSNKRYTGSAMRTLCPPN